MRKFVLRGLAAVVILLICSCYVQAATPLQRVANKTLELPQIVTAGYGSANAFSNLTFANPVCIVSPPGETNRLFILEKRGRIIVITNLAAPTRTVFMDIAPRVWLTTDSIYSEEGLLGMAFHPGFATNRYFYLYYVGAPGWQRHDMLSRFEVSAFDPNVGLRESEVVLFSQYDTEEGHNAGDLHFGPDGYLYVSLGDGGVPNENPLRNGQRIDLDLFSSILRLDVDKRPGSLPPNPHQSVTTNYAIPADNPFVGATTFNGLPVDPNKVRTEMWAVGFRNPWRMSFDQVTGRLYVGDVGGSREVVNLIVKGGNYGWPYYSGTAVYFGLPTNPPAGFNFQQTPPLRERVIAPPFIAIVGGRVYRGTRMPELNGAYVFGYYGHEIWALRHTGNQVTEIRQLLQNPTAVAYGTDPSNGDILFANVGNVGIDNLATVDRLTYLNGGGPAPPTLKATGAFADLVTLQPNAGVVPYDLNVPFWSDNAIKRRWFSVPNTNLTIGFSPDGNWSFPTGTVWIKHFELELTNGVAASRRRLETRLLVKNATSVHGLTYRWGNSLTNAELVPEEGLDESFVINQGGILRTQVWRYPSRLECLQCHTAAGGLALGFKTAQLNRTFDYDGVVTNQIAALSHAGYFSAGVPNLHTLPALVHPTNHQASLEARARSYLAANCVQCHQPNGGVQAFWDARPSTKTADAGLIHGPLYNPSAQVNSRVIVPGSLTNSMLFARMSRRGAGQMPPIGTSLVDTQGAALLAAWITNDLPSFQTYADWQQAKFGNTNLPAAQPFADPDRDGAVNQLEYLTRTGPSNALEAWKISIALSNGQPVVRFPQLSNRAFEVQSATSLSASVWSSLDVPGNTPFFASSNRNAAVIDTRNTNATKFYRVRVFEP